MAAGLAFGRLSLTIWYAPEERHETSVADRTLLGIAVLMWPLAALLTVFLLAAIVCGHIVTGAPLRRPRRAVGSDETR